MKQILVLICLFPMLLQGQEDASFDKLIQETNHYLNQYATLSPFDSEYHLISSFDLAQKEREDLIAEANTDIYYGQSLSANKDSILSQYMISYLQKRITGHLNQIVKHPDFQKKDIQNLITSDEMSIVVSDDKKLYNFSFDEKTGGTYRSQISMMYYSEFVPEDSTQANEFQSFFSSDGYTGIYTLNTPEGVKYVLTSSTRFCSLCFASTVRLVSFTKDHFIEEFIHSIATRSWEGGVYYDPIKKIINVDYILDDLTSNCSCCEKNQIEWSEDQFSIFAYNCCYSFVFDGTNFKKVDGVLKKVIDTDQDISEVLSFKMAKNNKEVKVLVHNHQTLTYVFLKPDGQVEFSFPIQGYEKNIDFKINENSSKLTFSNGDVIYQIYETIENGSDKRVGVLVIINDKTYDLKGDLNTLKGSLKNIEVVKLHNVSEE